MPVHFWYLAHVPFDGGGEANGVEQHRGELRAGCLRIDPPGLFGMIVWRLEQPSVQCEPYVR